MKTRMICLSLLGLGLFQSLAFASGNATSTVGNLSFESCDGPEMVYSDIVEATTVSSVGRGDLVNVLLIISQSFPNPDVGGYTLEILVKQEWKRLHIFRSPSRPWLAPMHEFESQFSPSLLGLNVEDLAGKQLRLQVYRQARKVEVEAVQLIGRGDVVNATLNFSEPVVNADQWLYVGGGSIFVREDLQMAAGAWTSSLRGQWSPLLVGTTPDELNGQDVCLISLGVPRG